MLVLDGKLPRGWSFTAVAFSPDDRWLAASGTGPVRVWDMTRTALVHFPEDAAISVGTDRLRFHPADGWLYAATAHGLIAYNPTTGRIRALEPFQSGTGCIALDSGGERLVGYAGGRLVLVDRPDQPNPQTVWSVLVESLPGAAGWSRSVYFFPDGERFASAEFVNAVDVRDNHYRVVVRSAATGEILDRSREPRREVDQLAVSQRGALVGRHGMLLIVYDAANLGRAPRLISNENRKHFTGLAFHPSGRYLAVTSNDTTVKLYDTATWQPAKTFTWNVGRLRSVAFSPDGTRAAVGSDRGKVVVWDVDL